MPAKETSPPSALLPLLTQADVIPSKELASLWERSGNDRELARLILREGYLTAEQLAQLRAQEGGWHFVDLRQELVTPTLLALLPYPVISTQRVVPFRQVDGGVSLALQDPSPRPFTRLLRKRFGGEMQLFSATEQAVFATLAAAGADVDGRYQALLQNAVTLWQGKGEDRAVIDLVELLLRDASRRGASDIHLEPQEGEVAVRFRVDGMLQRTLALSHDIHGRVLLRIKILGNLATDEHMIPQDGKLLYKSPEGVRIDVRISIIPTIHGEKVVLRLLVSEEQALPLESLGLAPPARAILEEQSKRTWGMILVTGPTGSGKTTTLYAVMRRLNREHVNISTIEDPVEYRLPGANQMQVHEKVGLTFATGLRSLVRQDPNIILVGEIRDRETAGIAVNASLTGHLVLSTLHTNDAPTAIPRLIDMGVEPFLIASTVNVIMAQRLVRTLCVRCREGRDATTAGLLHEGIPADMVKRLLGEKESLRLYQGKGCDLCRGSGFRGRTAIVEVLPIGEDLRSLIVERASADVLHAAAGKKGWQTMVDDGLAKVRKGVTTIEEVLRVIHSSL